MTRTANRLALLVGSNPLPNYIAAMVLNPREVVLIYSPETKDPRDRLRAALAPRNITVNDVCIDDATDARKIREKCEGIEIDHLHYSGGTKPMAAHARQACKLTDSQASYLDERNCLLRFDDQICIKLSQHDLGLTLDLLLELHDSKRKGPRRADGANPQDDVDALAKAALSPSGTSPDESDGRWLERWVANQVVTCVPESKPDVSVHCTRNKQARDFEVDVALIRGHRLFVASCTTSRKLDRCKSKLFEVAMRARQMGGDLARSAVVCLLEGSDQQGRPYVELLRGDIASVWDAPNVPRVFGLSDLREWAGTSAAPNLGTLQEWLES
jgi:hypothetical protein